MLKTSAAICNSSIPKHKSIWYAKHNGILLKFEDVPVVREQKQLPHYQRYQAREN